MVGLAIGLLIVGVLLSAFFSGCETGFYRASRFRFVMDGMEGDRFSKRLLSLTNNPQLFVATTLIGNNVANYLVSLAVVLIAGEWFADSSNWVELVAPIVLAPVLFVYGELLPKNLFFGAPNRLLRLCAPPFLFFTLLFAPFSALLWGLGRLLERVLGQSPERVQTTLARKEIHQVISEGHDAGLLHETQKYLAQNFFVHACKSVAEKCRPISKFPSLDQASSCNMALRLAKKHSLNALPIQDQQTKQLIGYVRAAELVIRASDEQAVQPYIHELIEIQADELHGEALLKMQSTRNTLAKVVDQTGETIGLLTLKSLAEPLLSGPLLPLRR